MGVMALMLVTLVILVILGMALRRMENAFAYQIVTAKIVDLMAVGVPVVLV
jgi:hypothetical protein